MLLGQMGVGWPGVRMAASLAKQSWKMKVSTAGFSTSLRPLFL